jgi:hypothetical protein
MIQLDEREAHSSARPAKAVVSLHEQWTAQYGPLVADQLHPSARYTLIRIGSAEFAHTDLNHYLRGLGQAWAAGFVPDPLPTAAGSDLLEAAPNLRGVDVDLTDLEETDVAPRGRRFS